jgi:flagella basal body P-ring formation protein FlgA
MVRIPSKYRRWIMGLGVGSTLVAGVLKAEGTQVGSQGGTQDVAQLEALAKSQAALQFPPLTERQRFVVGPLDARLRLERCSQPVNAVVGPGQHMRDRVMVELRCPATPAWHVYVPVRIVGTSTVTLAAHAIVVGSVLTEKDVRTEQRDVSELPPGYMDDPTVAIGLTVSRPISSGAVITNQYLVAAKAVQRGQEVTLVADIGSMSVRMAGRALSDGLMNQRVKVENLSSGKIVEGIARSAQVVEIISQ